MKKLNTRLKSTFIGCGQCGCQVIAETARKIMELDGTKDNVSFVGINTSMEDLSAVNLPHKIHVKDCNGAAGNRERSLDALAGNIDEIVGIHGAVNEDYPEDFLDILLLMADESVVTISVKY